MNSRTVASQQQNIHALVREGNQCQTTSKKEQLFNKTPYQDFMALCTQGTITAREPRGAGSDPLGSPTVGSTSTAPLDAAAAGTCAGGI